MKSELLDLQLRHDNNKRQTLDMFLGMFNDLNTTGRIRGSSTEQLRKAEMYQSSPNLNSDMMTSSYSSSLSSSISTHSGMSVPGGSRPDLHLSDSLSSTLSPSNSKENLTSPSYTPPAGRNSQFLDRVSHLKSRLTQVLERDFNVLPDTADLTRSVRLRRNKCRSGRVFTVLTRAAKGGTSFTDNTFPVPLGRRRTYW